LLHIPPKSDFPGTGPNGNGISERIRDQGEWIELTKTDGCEGCHQLGDKSTREIPANLGAFDTSVAAWVRRIQSGQVGSTMSARATQMGRKRALEMYADWTDRIKAGELPPVPPRPQGMERNVVVTEWDWAGPKDYFHDEISVDRRNPNSNPNGLVYGVHANSTDLLTILDPVKNTMTQIPIPVKPGTPQAEPEEVLAASVYKNLALREFFDLDILVDVADVTHAAELLIAHGYQCQTRLSEAQLRSYLSSGCELCFERDGVAVELHWRIAPRMYSLPFTFSELRGFSYSSIELLNDFSLFVDEQLRVAHHVDKQDVRNLKVRTRF